MAKWGFLTNQALVLFHIFQHPQSTLREISGEVGITERATLSCLRQMEEEQLVSRVKEGRRVRYTVNVEGVLEFRTPGGTSIEEIAMMVVRVATELRKAQRKSGG
jgi:predicted transcriptional regulator